MKRVNTFGDKNKHSAIFLLSIENLLSFNMFIKNNAKDFLTFTSRYIFSAVSNDMDTIHEAQTIDCNMLNYLKNEDSNKIEKLDTTIKGFKGQNYLCHCIHLMSGVGGTIITNREYPPMVAHRILYELLSDFEDFINHPDNKNIKHLINTSSKDISVDAFKPQLKKVMHKGQDPKEIDKIEKIRQELDKSFDIMYKNIELLIDRGDKLDILVKKSTDLSQSSKIFYKQAAKQNRCCFIM